MYLKLNHQGLDVFEAAKNLVGHCYVMTRSLPQEERFALSAQLRRAAMSVLLNLAEGCSRKSALERRRFFEISRGSLVEIDAALDAAQQLGYYSKEPGGELALAMQRCFKILSSLITSCRNEA